MWRLIEMAGVVSFILITSVAYGLTLEWDPVTARTNGDLLGPGELKEYRLYNQRKLSKVIAVPTVTANVFPVSGLSYVWEVTAVDSKGHESDYSNAVPWVPTPVPTPVWPPAAPKNFEKVP